MSTRRKAPTPPPKPTFGTDGIRGLTGETITPELLFALGLSAAALTPSQLVAACRDGRQYGEQLLAAFRDGVLAGGGQVLNADVLPSGMLSWLCSQRTDIALAAVITASHNPPEYNGIKFYNGTGAKITRALEQRLLANWPPQNVPGASAKQAGAVEHLAPDAFCASLAASLADYLQMPHPLKGMKLAVDCANGAGGAVADKLLEALGAEVELHNTQGDINSGCGANHPQQLVALMRAGSRDFGLALDGDGDRLVLVTADGKVLEGDEILYLLTVLDPVPGVAGTSMTNSGLELALRRMQVEFARSDVGEVPLHDLMLERGWQRGGEPSGHLLNLDFHQSADGLINAAHLLGLINRQDADVVVLLAGYQPLAQTQTQIPCPDTGQLAQSGIAELLADFERRLPGRAGEGSRLLVRPSGTEPVLRIMVEAEEADTSEALAAELAHALSEVLGATPDADADDELRQVQR